MVSKDSSLTFVNKHRSVDTRYKIEYNCKSDEYTVMQSSIKSNRVMSKHKITLAKIAAALQYNCNCGIITLVPENTGTCYDFNREQLQQWVIDTQWDDIHRRQLQFVAKTFQIVV